MNKNHRFLISNILLLATLHFYAPAESHAQGEVHGGEVIFIHGRPVLRDRVEDASVSCRYGWEVLKDIPLWKTLLQSIQAQNWYVAHAYETEAAHLLFCFGNAELLKVWEDDPDANAYLYMAPGKNERTARVAIRKGDIVRVNQALFDDLSDQDQAGLAFHETTHVFVANCNVHGEFRARTTRQAIACAAERKRKVISFTHFVMGLAEHETTPDAFALQMKVNGIQLSTDYRFLNAMRAGLETLFDLSADPKLRIVAAQASRAALPYLVRWDLEYFQDPNLRLASAVVQGDVKCTHSLLTAGADPNAYGILNVAIHRNDLEMVRELLKMENLRLNGALDLAYEEKRPEIFALLAQDDRAVVSEGVLKEILNPVHHESASWLLQIALSPGVAWQLGFCTLMDRVLAAFGSEKAVQEVAFEMIIHSESKPSMKKKYYAYALNKKFFRVIQKLSSTFPEKLWLLENELSEDGMDLAIQNDDHALFDQMIVLPIDLNQLRPDGNTYLDEAVIYDRLELVQKLAADPRVRVNQGNAIGKTALDLAIQFNRIRIQAWLEQNAKSTGSTKE